MRHYTTRMIAIVLFFTAAGAWSENTQSHFKVIPLGTSGGEFQDNLSAYLVAPLQSNDWISLDTGTLCSAINKLPFSKLKKLNIESPKKLFTENIKAYLISHAHLDHVNGLIICSTTDTHKNILAIRTTIDYIKNYLFNWKIWPNFGDQGSTPLLKLFHYMPLEEGQNTPIPQTQFRVSAFPLNHGNGYPSTAFLLDANQYYLLYLGDTGADQIEHSHDLQKLWKAIAPLIREHKLSALFIECSYTNAQSDSLLFGHLKPKWLLRELHELAYITDFQHPQNALKGLKIVVTHIKQGLGKKEIGQEILLELNKGNNLGVDFIVPVQGKSLTF